MPQQRYFPQGVATDDAFCNRHAERSSLKQSIELNENIVLVAPRRYGKTSLIAQVLKESKFPGTCIDFFFVLTQTEVIKLLTDAVSELMTKLLPKTKSAGQKIIDAVRAINPKVSLNLLGQSIDINIKQAPEQSISELLLALNHFSEKANQPCVIVLDEFQQIGELKENHSIEAAIRHAAERSQFVSYIFSGSKQHMLNEMFSNRSRPLYHLCDLMTIQRIETSCYEKFLQKMAKKKWQKKMANDAILEIIMLTENHPYYLNALCRKIWHQTELPTLKLVRQTWDDYVNQQAPWIMSDISGLSLNRRKVITALAQETTKEPQGQAFSQRTGLNPSGIKRSLMDLMQMDLIIKNHNNHYAVSDPAIAYYIRGQLS